MPVKIIIKRTIAPESEVEVRPSLLQIRSLATAQKGYISGEALVNHDNPDEHIVISTWKALADWNDWQQNSERLELQRKVDQILGCKTVYTIYYNG